MDAVPTEGPPLRKPIDFVNPPTSVSSLPLLSQLLVSFLFIGPVTFADSRINRSTSSRVFLPYVPEMFSVLNTLPKLHHCGSKISFKNNGYEANCAPLSCHNISLRHLQLLILKNRALKDFMKHKQLFG